MDPERLEVSEVGFGTIVWSGDEQILRLPPACTLPEGRVLVRKEGERLVVEVVQDPLLVALQAMGPADPDDDFPDVDEHLLPLRDIEL